MNLGPEFATKAVISHNETMEWCKDIMKNVEIITYRPHDGILQSRNAYLTDVMHYRRHQLEY